MKKINILKKISILVLVLVVPGFLYYLLTSQGKNRYKPLAYFGPRQVAKTTHKVKGKVIPDTTYHSLPDFKLTDQNGEEVTLASLDNQVFVASFFYTRCPSVCKAMNDYIKILTSNYAKNKAIRFVSITVDPEHDDLKTLRNYADSYKANASKWLFLTGDTSIVYNLARKGFLVNALQTAKDQFIYSDQIILVDQHKHIRGYYTGASGLDMTRLNDEIKVLILEELRNKDVALY